MTDHTPDLTTDHTPENATETFAAYIKRFSLAFR